MKKLRKIYESFKHLDTHVQWDERHQFRLMSMSKSLAIPMIKITHIPLMLLALAWSSATYAEICDYEDVPNLLDTVEVIQHPAMPSFDSLMSQTKEEREVLIQEFKAQSEVAEKNMFYRSYLRNSFNIWAPIDCRRQMNATESIKWELEMLHLNPPYDKNNADNIILGKVIDMAYSGRSVEEIQEMVQKTFQEFLKREKRGERIRWQ